MFSAIFVVASRDDNLTLPIHWLPATASRAPRTRSLRAVFFLPLGIANNSFPITVVIVVLRVSRGVHPPKEELSYRCSTIVPSFFLSYQFQLQTLPVSRVGHAPSPSNSIRIPVPAPLLISKPFHSAVYKPTTPYNHRCGATLDVPSA